MFPSIQVNAQYTLWDILYCLNGGEQKTVGINPSGNPNPVEKPGWNLIFQDEFSSDTLNKIKWNRSTPWDDGDGTCSRNFVKNPANITTKNQILSILNTDSSYLANCSFSSGEIKSLSVRDTTFCPYYFYASGYLEARVKLFNKSGQGAAMWLWAVGTPDKPGESNGPWFEIDVFEQNGSSGNKFTGSYHWTSDDKKALQLHQISLTDSSGTYDLTENWTTFGLEWDISSIKWIVNNVVVKDLDLAKIPPYCVDVDQYSQPVSPFCLRLSSGPNTVGNQTIQPNGTDMPQSFLVDYVRVYKKNGQKAAPIRVRDSIPQICACDSTPELSHKIISTRYYPDVTYSWSSPAFEFAPVHEEIPRPPENMKLWIKPRIPGNQSYPVYLQTTFLSGYHEKDTLYLYIPEMPPDIPSSELVALRLDSSCYYSVMTPVDPYTTSCEYSFDNGLTWKESFCVDFHGKKYWFFKTLPPQEFLALKYRVNNACGCSQIKYDSLTTPPPVPGCYWPQGYPDTIKIPHRKNYQDVILIPNPAQDILRIKLKKGIQKDDDHVTINIFDITAKLVLKTELNYKTNAIDLRPLSPGMYVIQIYCDNEIIFTGQLLKE